jgi:16S rRNA (uracil1498-N3)-methyltransferase
VRTTRVPVSGLTAGERRLEGDEAHYLSRVHRLGPGDTFVAFDPAARLEAAGEILGLDREAISVRLGEPTRSRAVPRLDVTLVQCIGKGDKMDDVVRATTALGVGTVVVAESERTVARLDAERGARRAERWRAIALDAARQSGRGDVPEIEGPRPLADALAAFDAVAATKLCLDPLTTAAFSNALSLDKGPKRLVLLVGPEGGLTDDELTGAERSGFRRVRLGPFVLRTELAATVALGALVAILDAAD